jgi:predicted DNA-binding protein
MRWKVFKDCEFSDFAILIWQEINTMLAIRLPPEAEALLHDLAQRRGSDPKTVALRAVLDYLEDEEDARIAEAALDEHYKTGGKTYTLEDVAKKLGLED